MLELLELKRQMDADYAVLKQMLPFQSPAAAVKQLSIANKCREVVVQDVNVCISTFCAVVKHKNLCLSVIRLAHHTSLLLMVEVKKMRIFCIINLSDRAIMKFEIAVACSAHGTWDFGNGYSCKIFGKSKHRADSLYRLSSLNL